jgi:hypothetical protein
VAAVGERVQCLPHHQGVQNLVDAVALWLREVLIEGEQRARRWALSYVVGDGARDHGEVGADGAPSRVETGRAPP